MQHVVTIRSQPQQGGLIEITIEASGSDNAVITVRTWPADKPGPPAKPAKIDVQHLFDVRLAPSKSAITCRVSAFGASHVNCTLDAGSGAENRSVTIVVSGTFGGLWDSKDTYPVPDADYQALLTFVQSSGFPSA